MRLSVVFILIFVILCEASGPIHRSAPRFPPRIEKVSPEDAGALAILLRKQYVRALTLIDIVYAPEKNGSALSRSSNQLINGALYIADIATQRNKYTKQDKYTTTGSPNEITINSPNEVPPPTPATPTSPEENHAGRETPKIIPNLSDYEAGSSGKSTARDSAIEKIKVVGAVLTFVGAVFTLL